MGTIRKIISGLLRLLFIIAIGIYFLFPNAIASEIKKVSINDVVKDEIVSEKTGLNITHEKTCAFAELFDDFVVENHIN